MLPNANNPDGYSSDRTNLGSKDGEKTDTTSKRNLKTNITKMFVKNLKQINRTDICTNFYPLSNKLFK